MSYTITKYKDVFTLTNTDATFSLDFDVTLLNGCYEYLETQASQSLAIGLTSDLVLVDGEYKLNITQNAVVTSAIVKNYKDLMLNIVSDVNLLLCGCDCDCDDCVMNCNDTLTLVVKMMSYMALTYPQYNLALEKVSEVIKCLLGMDVSCLLINEKITGENDSDDLQKKIVATYYLAFYFVEKIQSADIEEESYINTKYNFNTISPCITKLGIDIAEVETIINNNMGTITINSGAYVNLPPDNVGDNTLNVNNRAVTTITLAIVTTLTTPAYSDPEGDPVDALRVDTLPVDGVLKIDGVAALVNDVISAADINLNKLTYESPNQDALDNDSWNVSLRDTGSLQWSS